MGKEVEIDRKQSEEVNIDGNTEEEVFNQIEEATGEKAISEYKEPNNSLYAEDIKVLNIHLCDNDVNTETPSGFRGDNFTYVLKKLNEKDIPSVINECVNEYFVEDSEFTHVVFTIDGIELSENYFDLVKEHVKDPNAVYLPISELLNYDSEKEQYKFKSFLNVCLWDFAMIANIANEDNVGVLYKDVAVKQIDTLLFGAIIPTNIIKKYPFKENIKYFYNFEWLNRVTYKGEKVYGIPKCLVSCYFDYEMNDVNNDEKKKYFLASQNEFTVDEERGLSQYDEN